MPDQPPAATDTQTGPAAFATGQVITIFRSRLRPEATAEFHPLAEEVLALARTMPGFVDYKSFAAPDGERVSVVTFADAETQAGWRHQVDHQAAQAAGRDRFYADYSLQVGTCEIAHTFTAPAPVPS